MGEVSGGRGEREGVEGQGFILLLVINTQGTTFPIG